MRWSSVASSSDGTKLVGTVGYTTYYTSASGQIYTSINSGVTWTARASSLPWSSVASSADGTKLVAAVYGTSASAGVYTSTDSGGTWTLRDAVSLLHRRGIIGGWDETGRGPFRRDGPGHLHFNQLGCGRELATAHQYQQLYLRGVFSGWKPAGRGNQQRPDLSFHGFRRHVDCAEYARYRPNNVRRFLVRRFNAGNHHRRIVRQHFRLLRFRRQLETTGRSAHRLVGGHRCLRRRQPACGGGLWRQYLHIIPEQYDNRHVGLFERPATQRH